MESSFVMVKDFCVSIGDIVYMEMAEYENIKQYESESLDGEPYTITKMYYHIKVHLRGLPFIVAVWEDEGKRDSEYQKITEALWKKTTKNSSLGMQ